MLSLVVGFFGSVAERSDLVECPGAIKLMIVLQWVLSAYFEEQLGADKLTPTLRWHIALHKHKPESLEKYSPVWVCAGHAYTATDGRREVRMLAS